MLGTLFANSNGQQRAGILNKLLSAVGPGMFASGGLSSLAGLLRGGNNVTPEQADQIPPETVQELAEHAEKQNPSITSRLSKNKGEGMSFLAWIVLGLFNVVVV